MDFNQYQSLASRTMTQDETMPPVLHVLNYTLGLVGEAGETADLIKKFAFHGHEIDHEKLEKELGDVLWYVSALATIFGYSLTEVAEINIEKLMKRYPEGFKTEDSVNREE